MTHPAAHDLSSPNMMCGIAVPFVAKLHSIQACGVSQANFPAPASKVHVQFHSTDPYYHPAARLHCLHRCRKHPPSPCRHRGDCLGLGGLQRCSCILELQKGVSERVSLRPHPAKTITKEHHHWHGGYCTSTVPDGHACHGRCVSILTHTA